MPSKVQQAKGKWGEILAKNYLLHKGYQWIASNYHTRYGEIDLIFKDTNILVFVEVKTRKSDDPYIFEETITQEKVKRILKSAEIYIDSCDISFNEMRIDAIFIRQENEQVDISHMENFV